jgi:hypothetical protein
MDQEPIIEDSEPKALSSMFGFILYTVAICSNQVAYTLMKLALKDVEELNQKNEGPPKKVFCTCKWWTGFVTLMAATVLMMSALPFADMVLLS